MPLILDAQKKGLKRGGKEDVSQKPAIEEEDLHKLKTSEGFPVPTTFPSEERLVSRCAFLLPKRP